MAYTIWDFPNIFMTGGVRGAEISGVENA